MQLRISGNNFISSIIIAQHMPMISEMLTTDDEQQKKKKKITNRTEH